MTQPQEVLQDKISMEDAAAEDFRSSLKEVIVIVEKLAPHCSTVEDLIGLARLAITNDAQLRLLIKEVAPLRFRK